MNTKFRETILYINMEINSFSLLSPKIPVLFLSRVDASHPRVIGDAVNR